MLTQEERTVHSLIILSNVALRFDMIWILQYNCLFLHYYNMYSYYLLKKKRIGNGCMSVIVCAKCLQVTS